MTSFEFKYPLILLLLIPYCAMVFIYIRKKLYSRGAAAAISAAIIAARKESFRTRTYRFLPVLRFLSILLLIIALARPGIGIDYSSVKNRGIDIMIALDLSLSMMGEDFQPENRLGVAKKAVYDFIDMRKTDRIGLVVFAGEAYLQSPLTVEHQMIKDIVMDLDFKTVEIDGTAIGDAIALSASRMIESGAKSRIILLLTDGMNNRGSIDPVTAAETCAEMGIKVYSVGIGKEGRVPYPNPGGFFPGKRYLENHFDESILKQVSEKTSGAFYRAESGGVLWEKVQEIDRLEKSEIDINMYHEFHDKFQIYLAAAVILFFLEIILRSAVYRKIP